MECLSSVKMCTNIINSVYQIWCVTVHMCSCVLSLYLHIIFYWLEASHGLEMSAMTNFMFFNVCHMATIQTAAGF